MLHIREWLRLISQHFTYQNIIFLNSCLCGKIGWHSLLPINLIWLVCDSESFIDFFSSDSRASFMSIFTKKQEKILLDFSHCTTKYIIVLINMISVPLNHWTFQALQFLPCWTCHILSHQLWLLAVLAFSSWIRFQSLLQLLKQETLGFLSYKDTEKENVFIIKLLTLLIYSL